VIEWQKHRNLSNYCELQWIKHVFSNKTYHTMATTTMRHQSVV